MNQEELIRKLVDYILLNAYSVNSSGLYNGKAGLSLSLFGVARLLKDDYIEDQAHELLQEALLSTNEDIGFENGLGGIGYVLHYLIANRFVEADFNELFGEKMDKIRKLLEEAQAKKTKSLIVGNPLLVHFLNAMKAYYPEDEMNYWINLFSLELAQLLEERLDKLVAVVNRESKVSTLRMFEIYIELVGHYHSFIPVWSLFDKYEELYQTDKLLSSFTIGYYLKCIATIYNRHHLESVGMENMERAAQSLYPDAMSLSQQLDILYLLQESRMKIPQRMEAAEHDLFSVDNHPDEYEQRILGDFRSISFVAGYQCGIARLLLYWVYKKTPNLIGHLFL